jgi:hypothetical protein
VLNAPARKTLQSDGTGIYRRSRTVSGIIVAARRKENTVPDDRCAASLGGNGGNVNTAK